MKEKWLIMRKGADYKGLSKALGVDPVIVRIMRNRGLQTRQQMQEYLHGDRSMLHDPHLLKDADRAANILKEKIRTKKKIRIIGDYDIDGIMSVYILLQALKRCGADVDEVIPDRIRDGYGLNIHLIDEADRDQVDTILTCDNGISAIEQVRYAGKLGMTVIVTDHHEVPFEMKNGVKREILVKADAVVNLKQQKDTYPFPGLCGAAVAFKLVQVLYEHMGIPVEEADAFLEEAGFATIGDVMDLQKENRLLAGIGLEKLNHTSNIGMQALIAQNDLKPGMIRCYHVGFRLGPCLNASGRLETAQLSLRLLNSQSTREAVPLAIEITELNRQRKSMTESALLKAEQAIEENHFQDDRVLVVFIPDCHESLAGIVAGRLRERYYRPVLVITRGENSAKGSGRSIEEYSMFEELNRCRDLFLNFGGHPMAAGFSLKEEDIDELRRRLNEYCSLTPDQLMPKVHIDVDMPLEYITEDLVRQLDLLEPFGKANEKPVFAEKNLAIQNLRIVGRENNVLQMTLVSPRGQSMRAVYFGDPQEFADAVREKYGKIASDRLMAGEQCPDVRMHFCYYPELNTYRGVTSIQLIIRSFC